MSLTYRSTYFICFLLGIILIAGMSYIEIRLGIVPCLLCLLQRCILGILMVFFLLGFIFPWPKLIRMILNSLVVLFALLGWGAAARQVWLQNVSALHPGSATNCLPDATFLLQHLPLTEVIKLTVVGTQECSRIDWSFLGLSLAKWSVLFFLMFFVAGIRQFFRAQ